MELTIIDILGFKKNFFEPLFTFFHNLCIFAVQNPNYETENINSNFGGSIGIHEPGSRSPADLEYRDSREAVGRGVRQG